jgi:hypothetical protein
MQVALIFLGSEFKKTSETLKIDARSAQNTSGKQRLGRIVFDKVSGFIPKFFTDELIDWQ